MSRWYDTVFERPDGRLITIRASGNTKTSAERWARRKLKDHKLASKDCITIRTVFVPAAALDPERPWIRPEDK